MIISFYITLYCRLDGHYRCLELYRASYVLGPASREGLVYQVSWYKVTATRYLDGRIRPEGLDSFVLALALALAVIIRPYVTKKKGISSRLSLYEKNHTLKKLDFVNHTQPLT